MSSRRSALALGLLSTVSALATPGTSAPRGEEITYTQYSTASYGLVQSYTASNFLSDFTFFTASDPTSGYVNYVSESVAAADGLYKITNNQIYLGVDHTTVNPASPGRNSVRVTSNQAYTHGLYIADIAHMPGDACGIWPAFWLFGPNWPASGEIDIIEGINLAGTDTITLHTSSGCTVNIAGSQSGTTLSNADCGANSGYTGCGVTTTTANAYGTAFNNNGGGVYAMQWESSGVYVWFWPHGSVPADVAAGAPVTGNWGTPIVAFNGGSGCTVDNHFMNENIVFDTTFCGTWAGTAASWSSSGCSAYASTCSAYVAANPSAYTQGYWLINSVKVYSL